MGGIHIAREIMKQSLS
jgi:adenylate/nucleoside-diphosphate kinase